MAIGYGVACPKPEKRQKAKGRKLRAESKQKHMVRMLCVARDGDYCRIVTGMMPDSYRLKDSPWHCEGKSEWVHMHARRRSQTRNMAPEIRHDSAHSLCLCSFHHREYDAHRLKITALTRKGADGPLKFSRAK